MQHIMHCFRSVKIYMRFGFDTLPFHKSPITYTYLPIWISYVITFSLRFIFQVFLRVFSICWDAFFFLFLFYTISLQIHSQLHKVLFYWKFFKWGFYVFTFSLIKLSNGFEQKLASFGLKTPFKIQMGWEVQSKRNWEAKWPEQSWAKLSPKCPASQAKSLQKAIRQNANISKIEWSGEEEEGGGGESRN